MTTETPTRLDPLADAIAAVEGVAELEDLPLPAMDAEGAVRPREVLIIDYSGLQVFVKDSKRITGENWMQRMLSAMQRPGISHRKLSKMNFFGMGPWMMGRLARQYGVASPKELLEAAQELGVEFIPCQMTMDMFGLKPEDMIDGMGEPVGAATVIGMMTGDSVPLFI
jgi:peroxiredoxin family protein